MAWLDPNKTNYDWAYVGMRSAFVAINKSNGKQGSQGISTVLCPDICGVCI